MGSKELHPRNHSDRLRSKPQMDRAIDDLPDPDSPINASVLPGAMSRDTPATAMRSQISATSARSWTMCCQVVE